MMEWQQYTETTNQADVFRQLEALGYEISQRSFYRHCSQGKCRRNDNRVFTRRLVKQYVEAEGLLRKGETVGDSGPDVALSIEKQQLENKKLDWANKKAELDYKKASGQLIEREAIYLELAAREVVLVNSFEHEVIDERSRELIVAVNGDLGKVHEFQDLLRALFADLMNSFCDTKEFEVLFEDGAGGDAGDDGGII